MIKVHPDAKTDRGAWVIIDDQHNFDQSAKRNAKDLALLKKYADQLEASDRDILVVDASPELSLAWAGSPKESSTFALLKHCRKIIAALKERRRSRIVLDLTHCKKQDLWLDAFVAAYSAAHFSPDAFKRKESNKKESATKKPFSELTIKGPKSLEASLKRAEATAEQTNTVRRLALLPANKLNPASYRDEVESIARKYQLRCEIFDEAKLKKWGCGAFLAVAQGSAHNDAAIVKLSYNGRKGEGVDLCYVGKGVTFDTGGVNVKPGNSMNGMHGDMTGSAVALGLICLAAQLKWPYHIEAYLAIADNAIGSQAYRPNEVVVAANGLSIETVHTDAEGRMMLSDTLAIASRSKPKFIIDFATLTGSAIRAIGTNYSAAFSNRAELHPTILEAGIHSGERVWPFPTDADYGECLDSEIADIKQCRLSAGPDHIEAAVFLARFVEEGCGWIHVDLSAAENDGGLAHVATKETGFGIRFGASLTQLLLA